MDMDSEKDYDRLGKMSGGCMVDRYMGNRHETGFKQV